MRAVLAAALAGNSVVFLKQSTLFKIDIIYSHPRPSPRTVQRPKVRRNGSGSASSPARKDAYLLYAVPPRAQTGGKRRQVGPRFPEKPWTKSSAAGAPLARMASIDGLRLVLEDEADIVRSSCIGCGEMP
jgi:hypothetical protein